MAAFHRDGHLFKVAVANVTLSTLRVDTSPHIDGRYLSELSGLSEESVLAHSVSGIGSRALLIRSIRSPLRDKRALKKTLPFQLEERIPVPLQEVFACPIRHRKEGVGKKDLVRVTYMIAPGSALADHVARAPVNPAYVSCVPIALVRFAEHAVTGVPERYVICHVGEEETELIVVQSGIPIRNAFVAGGTGLLRANREKYEHETGKAFFRLYDEEEENREIPLLFTGATEAWPAIEQRLPALGISFSRLTVRSEYQGNMREYAVAIGLAREAWSRDNRSVRFREANRLTHEQATFSLRRLKRSVLLFSGLLLLFLCFTNIAEYVREKNLKNAIREIATSSGQEINHPEKVLRATGIERKLALLQREIGGSRHVRPLPPPSINVTSLLTRLLAPFPDQAREVRIERFRYVLTNYREVAQAFPPERVPYEVRVEFVFACPSKEQARALYEDVLRWQGVAGHQEEVAWTHEENLSHLSFVLYE